MTKKTIDELAYAMWESRGRPEGSAQADWLAAEQQIVGTETGAEAQLDRLDDDASKS